MVAKVVERSENTKRFLHISPTTPNTYLKTLEIPINKGIKEG